MFSHMHIGDIGENLFACTGFKLSLFVLQQRSADDKDKDQVTDICQNSAPCGWAVYKPFARTIEYFIKNRYIDTFE